jgi:hypothetical protein
LYFSNFGRDTLFQRVWSRYQAQPGPTLHVLFDAIHDPPHGFPVVQILHQVRPLPLLVGGGAK